MISIAVPFVAALALVPVLVRFAIGRNLLDVPNARSSHEIPTPRLGGLALILGVWAVSPFLGEASSSSSPRRLLERSASSTTSWTCRSG